MIELIALVLSRFDTSASFSILAIQRGNTCVDRAAGNANVINRRTWRIAAASVHVKEDHMRAYKVIPPRAYQPVAYLSGMDNAKPLDAALEEFQSTYGLNKHHTVRDLRKRDQAHVNLARDASFLGLEHNPLYHELSLVFIDWAKKRFGYQSIDPQDAAKDAEDLRFPY